MNTTILAMHAMSALKEIKSELWDTLGWNLYLTLSRTSDASEEEKLTTWKEAIDEQHTRWTHKYRQYAKASGIHAQFSQEEARERQDQAYGDDMESWEQVRIVRIERMGDILKFFTVSGDTFEMDVENIYSQIEFKKSVTRGTTIILPSIKKESFDRFIQTLSIIKIENIGMSLLEKVEEAIYTHKHRLRDTSLESEKDAIEAVANRGVALYNGCLYFRINHLMTDMWKTSVSVSPAKLVSALRDLGAETIKHRTFNFWKYAMASDTTSEPL